MDLRATTTIRRPPAEVYRFWREQENCPRSRWTASAPFGGTVEWEAEIEDEMPPEKTGWRSVGDTEVPNRGRAWFIPAPDGESTAVHVLLVYDIPGGDLGKAVAAYSGEEPHQELEDGYVSSTPSAAVSHSFGDGPPASGRIGQVMPEAWVASTDAG